MNTDLRAQVFESLRNAIENGYPITGWSDEEIAEDLNRCDAALEDVPAEELIPFIREWRELRRRVEPRGSMR